MNKFNKTKIQFLKLIKNFAIVFILLISINANSQVSTGTYSDFTLPVFGTSDTFNLFSYLDDGKMVVIDYFEYECGPCWGYHSQHILTQFYDLHGPNGDNTAMVVQICTFSDADSAKLTYNNGQSLNWLAGVTYPTLILPDDKFYAIFGFLNTGTPTIPRICPNKQYTYEHPTPGDGSTVSANYTLAGLNNWLYNECGVSSGIETIEKSIAIYPNPLNSTMFIEGMDDIKYDFRLINILGQEVINIQNNTASTIDVSNCSEGIYFAIFELENNVITKKVFVKH